MRVKTEEAERTHWIIFEAVIAQTSVTGILLGLILARIGLSISIRLVITISSVIVDVSSKRLVN